MYGYKTPTAPTGPDQRPPEQHDPPAQEAGPGNAALQDQLAASPQHEQPPGLLEQLLGGAGDALVSGWQTLTDDTPLRRGDEGVRVLAMQKGLARIGWEIECDGVFGQETEQILVEFQMRSELQADGIAGPLTLDALMGASTVDEIQAQEAEQAREEERLEHAGHEAPETSDTFDIPLRDVIYEQLAHRFAYFQFQASLMYNPVEDFSTYDKPRVDGFDKPIPQWWSILKRDERNLLDGLGYDIEVVHEDRLTGFQCVLFVPHLDGAPVEDHPHFDKLEAALEGGGPGLRPVVAFRGSQDQKSWADDYSPAGVGAYQFRMNEAEILELLAQGTSEVGPPDVVGHSLGGALAQLAAARHSSFVNEVVTFQAAGVNMEEAEAATQAGVEATHYRVKGDAVPLGGEAFVGGTEHTFQASHLSGTTDTHCGYPLQLIHAGAQPFSYEDRGYAYHDDFVPVPEPEAQSGAHLPALDAYHQEHDQVDQACGINRLHDPRHAKPGDGLQGSQEWGRRARVPELQKKHTQREDLLNGPIAWLIDELRAETEQARRSDDFDVDEHIAEMTRRIDGASRRLALQAALDLSGESPEQADHEILGPVRERLMSDLVDRFEAIFNERRRDELVARTARMIRLEESLR